MGFIAILAVLTPAASVRAQSEDQVKAAFLFNFVRYVEWPSNVFETDASKVKICVIGAKGFGSVVSQTVSGKSVGDRKVKVESLEDLEEASRCHLLYLGEDAPEDLADALAKLSELPVFTVSDSAGFSERGGMANFFRADNKIRFEMNPDAAKKARLKISSRLLRLAKVVK